MKEQKFIIILLFLILSLTSPIKSQEGISIGIKAGTGFSQYLFQIVGANVEQDFAQVYQGGFVFNQMNKKNLGIQLELLYNQKAWQENIGASYKKKFVIDYIEIPIHSIYKIGKKKSGIVISAGLHVSFALQADSSITGVEIPPDTTLIEYPPLQYSNWDYGLDGAVGYQFSIGRSLVLIQLMYSQGFRNMFERQYDSIYRSLNQSLYLNLIYKIHLGKKTAIPIEKKEI
jgi:hypothetical protein